MAGTNPRAASYWTRPSIQQGVVASMLERGNERYDMRRMRRLASITALPSPPPVDEVQVTNDLHLEDFRQGSLMNRPRSATAAYDEEGERPRAKRPAGFLSGNLIRPRPLRDARCSIRCRIWAIAGLSRPEFRAAPIVFGWRPARLTRSTSPGRGAKKRDLQNSPVLAPLASPSTPPATPIQKRLPRPHTASAMTTEKSHAGS